MLGGISKGLQTTIKSPRPNTSGVSPQPRIAVQPKPSGHYSVKEPNPHLRIASRCHSNLQPHSQPTDDKPTRDSD